MVLKRVIMLLYSVNLCRRHLSPSRRALRGRSKEERRLCLPRLLIRYFLILDEGSGMGVD